MAGKRLEKMSANELIRLFSELAKVKKDKRIHLPEYMMERSIAVIHTERMHLMS